MSSRLIVFIIVSMLVIGSVIVYTKNNIKPDESEKKNQELTNFGNPAVAGVNNQDQGIKSAVGSLSPTPTKAQVQQQTQVQNQVQDQAMQNVTELKIEDIKEGSGEPVKKGDSIEVNYLGVFLDGKKFDSSYDRNETFNFNVGAGQVIQGWDQGLIGMKVGGKRKLLIPSDLAYGPSGSGPIPPNTPLVFEIELISIK